MSSNESSDESYTEGKSNKRAKNRTTRNRGEQTPRKRKNSEDEPFLTPQQQSAKKWKNSKAKESPSMKGRKDGSAGEGDLSSNASNRTTRNRGEQTPRKRKISEDETFLTPQQQSAKKWKNSKTKENPSMKGRKEASAEFSENELYLTAQQQSATKRNKKTKESPLKKSNHNDNEENSFANLRRNPSRSSRESSVVSYAESGGSENEASEQATDPPGNKRKPRKVVSKKNPTRTKRDNSVVSRGSVDTENASQNPTPASPIFRTPRDPSKGKAGETGSSTRRNPPRSSRESSVASYRENDSDSDDLNCTPPNSGNQRKSVTSKKNLFNTGNKPTKTPKANRDKGVSQPKDISIGSVTVSGSKEVLPDEDEDDEEDDDDDDADYALPLQKSRNKHNRNRLKGKDLILADIAAERESNVSSGDEVQSPRCVSPLKIGDYKACNWCEALKFGDDEYCCRGGSVFIPPMEAMPKPLADLFGNTAESRKFKKSILTYNTLFSMASLQRHGIPAAPHGLPVQKVQGGVDAYPSAVFPHNPNQPAFANFYVYHGQDAIDMRTHMFQNADKDIVKKLNDVMEEHNQMAKNYKILKDFIEQSAKDPSMDENKYIRMKIINAWDVDNAKLQGHKGIYRTVEQKNKDYLAVFYTATVEQHDIDLPGLIIYPRRGTRNIRPIHYWNQLVDPLCYPLFFPYGEFGYRKKTYPIYKKHEKSYWLRLSDHQEAFPLSAVNSEAIQQSVQVGSQAASDLGYIQEAEEAEDSDEAHVRIVPTIENEPDLSANHDMARQFQEEVAMEDIRDIDYTDEDMNFDDIFSGEPEDTTANNNIAGSDESDQDPDKDKDSGNDSDNELSSKSKKRPFASQREYIVYQYQERKHILNRFLNSLLLGQLFLIHVLTRILRGRFDKIRQHITERVATTKSKVIKAMDRAAARNGIGLGIVTLLSEKIAGSPRWLQQKFENTVALSNKLGPPDMFMTATCNTEWPEIKDNLKPGQTWADNPFLVNNVFIEKFKKLLDLILGKRKRGGRERRPNKGIFGRVSWYSASVEFQQRGPPHVHMVFSLRKHIKTVAQIDKAVQAHLPKDPALRELVEKFMIHRPCEGDTTAYCRPTDKYKKSKQCKKNFPKEFAETTKHGDRHYPEYYRPDDGQKTMTGADNRYVVPYNTTLLSAWKGHINLEIVSALRVVKYIFKYLFKGFDRVLVETVTNCDNIDMSQMTVDGHLIYPKGLKIPPGALEKRKAEAIKHLKRLNVPLQDTNGQDVLVYDELLIVQDMRAVTSCEAAWDLARFPRHYCSHTVLEQGVHEENEEPLFFDADKLEEVAKKIQEDKIDTKLKAWFKLNQEEPAAHKFAYDEIPLFYTFKNGKWVEKERYDRCVLARILTVPPRNREAFAIRILCQNRKGIKSFEDLRTVDGKVYADFTTAAKALRLMNDQKEWEECLQEAAAKANPCQLRRLFMQILTNNDVAEPLALYNQFREEFFERRDNWTDEMKEAHSLFHMQSYLTVHGKKLENFGLPAINAQDLPAKSDLTDDSGRQQETVSKAFANKLRAGLQGEQSEIFEKIFGSVLRGNRDVNEKNAVFLQGSGGTGKTVTLKALFYNLLAEKKNVACVAHTGIAASLLPKGSTAHRFFHIPLRVEDTMSCQIELEQAEAAYLAQVDCVIWDEATMTDRRVYDAVDRLLRKLHPVSAHRPFGGVHFILAGDWKQTLPIVPDERSVGLVKYTLLKWKAWEEDEFDVFELTKNRRAEQDPEFAKLLEDVGWGRANISSGSCRPEDELVNLPSKCLMGSENEVIEKVFGGPGTAEEKFNVFKDSAILTVDNKTTFDVNKKVLKLLSTTEHTFLSVDTYDEKTGLHALNPETYHRVTPSGMPPHELNLKVGAVVILLRNLNVSLGLTNGTRLRIVEIGNSILRLRHVEQRKNIPDEVILTKLLFAPFNATSREVAFTRKQFPVRLSFCITCNRAQGQTLKRAGLILRSPCFSHGQLYVALSRVRSSRDLFIFNGSSDPTKTNNVVFSSVFYLLKNKLTNPPRLRGPKMQTTICATGTDGERNEILLQHEGNESSVSVQDRPGHCCDSYSDEEGNGPRDLDEYVRILTLANEEELARKDWTLEDYEFHDDPMSPEERVRTLTLYEELCKADAMATEGTDNPKIAVVMEPSSKSNIPENSRETRYQADDDSGSDFEYTDMFNGVQEEQSETSSSFPKLLKLHQIDNNCFANTTMQVFNYLWRQELLDYVGDDRLMITLRQIVTTSGPTSTVPLLNAAPGDADEVYNDGEQHDCDEYMLYLLQSMQNVAQIKKTVKLIQHTTDRCRDRSCQRVSTLAEANEWYITVTDRRQGLTLEEYILSLEMDEIIEKRCSNFRHNGDEAVSHTRRATFEVPPETKYLFVKMNLHANDYNQDNRIRFNNRKMKYKQENIAFGCLFGPIVMLEYTGSRKAGHYIAYIRNEKGWWLIDADRHTQLTGTPKMKDIRMIVLKKHMSRQQTSDASQVPVSGVSGTLNDQNSKNSTVDVNTSHIDTGTLSSQQAKEPNATTTTQGAKTGDDIGTSSSTINSIVKTVQFSQKRKVQIYNGNMLSVPTEAIVNAANPQLQNGGGVCYHIFKEAGEEAMEIACQDELKKRKIKELPPGDAVITPAFNLKNSKCKARFVIHTAAPKPVGDAATKEDENNLRQCYVNACRLASNAKLTKIVFPFLGTGLYNYGAKEGTSVAIQAIFLFFELYPKSSLQHVVFATTGRKVFKTAATLINMAKVFEFDSAATERRRMERSHGIGQETYQKEDGTSMVVATFVPDPADQPKTNSLRRAAKRLMSSII